ncbi:hypothetical protein B0H14DRAFT_2593142 [Mycena olivaceomarginata]|nr:hypothetical protein B0H14DRAFT_2593142 [Mycena olivaceomarginata]
MLDLLSVTLILCLLARDLIGMVRVGPDFRPPASRRRSPSLSVVASESEDLSDNDIASSTRPRAQSSGLHIPIQQVHSFLDASPGRIHVFMEYVPKHSTRSANQASTIQIAEHTIVDFESDGGSERKTAENSNGPITDPIILPAHSDEHSSSFRYVTAKTWIIDEELPLSDDIELNSDEQQEVEDDSEADEQDQLDEY